MAASSFWRDRRVFVTGGTGLLGKWLTRRLRENGAYVACLVRDSNCEALRSGLLQADAVVEGRVENRDLLERVLADYEITTVFHVAAQAIVGIANREPVATLETNVRGTWNLLEACRRSAAVQEVVITSSDKAYGEHEVLPYTEDMALRGPHPYEVSKSCADLLAQCYAQTFGLRLGITRCGNFYGGGDLNWNRVVPGTIRSVFEGQRPVIRSDGHFVRDYFYIEDGAEAHLLLAEQLANRAEISGLAFNFSNETQISVLDLVRLILHKMNSNLEPEIQNQASNEIRNQYLSAARAHRLLSWNPRFTLDSGLDRTIAWYVQYLSAAANQAAASGDAM